MVPLDASPHSPPPSSRIRRILTQHPLFSFFLLSYAFSWVMMIPVILWQWGVCQVDLGFAFVLKGYGPFLSAYIITRALEGRAGWLRLRGSIVRARVGWQWYLFVLLGVPLLYLLALLLMPGAIGSFHGVQPRFALAYLVTLAQAIIAEGPLGEEPGWRGFALPRMQPRFGPLRATLLLGLLWGFWHLPDFATTNQGGGPGADPVALASIDFPLFILYVVAVSLVFTWVFNHTRSSVFIAILLHASINTFPTVMALFAAPIVAGTNLPVLVGVAGPLLLVLVTRGRLGYDPSKKLPPGTAPREASPAP